VVPFVKLIAHAIDGQPFDIRAAPFDRPWMDATNEHFAYRCLPLNIANAHGWELLCPSTFIAGWRGGDGLDTVEIVPEPGTMAPAVSHFGYGVLTFHVPAIFRTEPGYDLMVQGPINRPRDGLSPLSGIVEADWAPFTFTMNWVFTRPGAAVRFEKGEPFCHVFLVRRGELESVEPELRLLSEDAKLNAAYEEWTASRSQVNADLRQPGSRAEAQKWQKHYHRGVDLAGHAAGVSDHRTRLRLKPFKGPEDTAGLSADLPDNLPD
jgi:hypothetical protein